MDDQQEGHEDSGPDCLGEGGGLAGGTEEGVATGSTEQEKTEAEEEHPKRRRLRKVDTDTSAVSLDSEGYPRMLSGMTEAKPMQQRNKSLMLQAFGGDSVVQKALQRGAGSAGEPKKRPAAADSVGLPRLVGVGKGFLRACYARDQSYIHLERDGQPKLFLVAASKKRSEKHHEVIAKVMQTLASCREITKETAREAKEAALAS